MHCVETYNVWVFFDKSARFSGRTKPDLSFSEKIPPLSERRKRRLKGAERAGKKPGTGRWTQGKPQKLQSRAGKRGKIAKGAGHAADKPQEGVGCRSESAEAFSVRDKFYG